MDVLELRTIDGPSIFHHAPVLVMTLDLGALADTPSTRLPPGRFVERLEQLAEVSSQR